VRTLALNHTFLRVAVARARAEHPGGKPAALLVAANTELTATLFHGSECSAAAWLECVANHLLCRAKSLGEQFPTRSGPLIVIPQRD